MRLVVTGDRFFLDRHRPLLSALAGFAQIDRVEAGNLAEWLPLRVYNRLTRGTGMHDRLLPPDPDPLNFSVRSRLMRRRLAKLPVRPDLVLHVFCSFAPQWDAAPPPYTMYLDYTMAQAIREYPPWADFHSPRRRARWLAFETRAYRHAKHIFTMTQAARTAVVDDYGVDETRVTVVGSGGTDAGEYAGAKGFGTHQIFFDGSAWHRKGGDILEAALPIVRRELADATLVAVGGNTGAEQPGMVKPGFVRDRKEMERLFLSSDLVVAPARCDPFPGFVVEALRYGVPCVVSAESGLASVVRDWNAGVVVQEQTAQAYASTIVALLRAPNRLMQMSEGGRRAVSERLNWTMVAALMEPGLQRAAEEGRRRGE